MRILAFVSGNLAAETMNIVIERLVETTCHEVTVISDGYYPTICVRHCKVIAPSDSAAFREVIAECDILLTSIRSPGTCERMLLRCANDCNVRSLVVLADLGSGAQKFRDSAGLVLPTFIAVSDEYTSERLRSQGIPSSVLVQIGSPYLDRISTLAHFAPVSRGVPTKLALLSLPNVLDFEIWGTPCLYTEGQVAEDCIALMAENSQRALNIRLHPKETVQGPSFPIPHTGRVRLTAASSQSPIAQFICSQHAIISTYSTGLLVSSLLGVKAISYQPTQHTAVREGFYRHIGLPIARNVEQLHECLATPETFGSSERLRKSLYNFGRSTDRLLDFIEQLF